MEMKLELELMLKLIRTSSSTLLIPEPDPIFFATTLLVRYPS
jgi:hypothetical protein